MQKIITFVLTLLVSSSLLGSERHVVLISIDGLMPSTYAEAGDPALEIPNLLSIRRDGAWAEGVIGVFPSVTYPSHTTLITGVSPAIHGIESNRYIDPLGTSDGAWRWYASEIEAPTLVSAAEEAGLRTASAWWPVSVGMDADLLVPEFWRSGHDSDRNLLELLSTPHILEQIGAFRGRPFPAPHAVTDRERVDIARFMIETFRPNMLLVHLIEVDFASHDHGPHSTEARAAIEQTDRYLGEVIESLRRAEMLEDTVIAIVSDHGFIETEHRLKPNLILRRAGMVDVDDSGRVRSWEAWFQVDSGLAMLHLADPDDDELVTRIEEIFRNLQEERRVLHSILSEEEIAALGANGRLALDAADGYKFSSGVSGEWIEPERGAATHGYDPRRPGVHASFLVGGAIDLCGNLGVISMTEIAPTLAEILKIQLDPAAPEPLRSEEPCRPSDTN